MARDRDDLVAALEDRAGRGTPRGGAEVVDAARRASLDDGPSRSSADRSGRRVRVVAAAAVLALVIGTLVVRASRDVPSAVETTPAAPLPASSWTRLATLPLDAGSVNPMTEAVWTGTEMIVPGGLLRRADGADELGQSPAYNPTSNTWRLIAAPPVAIGLDNVTPIVAWTGREVLYLTHVFDNRRLETTGPRRVGIAYDPSADRWRVIAQPPDLRDAAWAGDSLLAWMDDGSVVRYRPEADSWEPVVGRSTVVIGAPSDATRWTGDHLVVTSSRGTFAFDPRLARWTAGPPAPAGGAAATVVVGSTAHLVDGGAGRLASFDVATMTWSPHAALPMRDRSFDHDVVAVDGRLAVWGGQRFDTTPGSAPPADRLDGALYDPARDAWSPMPELPADLPATRGGVAAGPRLLAWGTTGGATPGAQTGLVAAQWQPPARVEEPGAGTTPPAAVATTPPVRSTPDPTPTALPGTTAPPPARTGATVSVAIYSGRVDPQWDLSASEQAQVNAAVDALPRAASDDMPPLGLGFIGFLAHGLRPVDRPAAVYVLRHWVVVPGDGDTRTVLDDRDSTVFRLLEDLALQHVDDPNARSAIESSINGR